jgi:hypothetical protein
LTFGDTPTVKLTENKLSHKHNFRGANFEYLCLDCITDGNFWGLPMSRANQHEDKGSYLCVAIPDTKTNKPEHGGRRIQLISKLSSTPQKLRSRFITVFSTCKDAFLKFGCHIFYIG